MTAKKSWISPRAVVRARWVGLAGVLAAACTIALRLCIGNDLPHQIPPLWSCGADALFRVAEQVDGRGAARLATQLAQSPGSLQGSRSMLDLANAARESGIAAAGVRVGLADDFPAPCVAHFRSDHFVAVLSKTDRDVVLFDDGVSRQMPRDEFVRLFSGAVLVLGERASQMTRGVSP